jgi:hypothetical protein
VADQVTIRAGWALWGKEPGTRTDYAVLACSPEPFSRAEFGTIITRFAAGTPDTRAGGPAELPWVTVSWVGVDASLQVGIGITDKTGQVDGVGRPIIQTSYCCVPYRELAANGITYTALYDAVERAPLPPENGAPVVLTLPVTTDEEVAQRADGFGSASSAAALLLRGPVSVVEAEGSSLRQRLEFIDAVASLLPYGYRAKFSAATWSDSATRHRLRLAFAARPRDDAAVVSWRYPGEVPGSDHVARAYYEQLRQLRSGSAAHGKKFDLGAVVAHLAARTEPQKFEQPQEALAILRQIDLPDRALRLVRDGAEVDLAELRQVVRPGPLGRLLPDEREDLLTALGERGSAEDWPVLRPWLEGLGDLGRLCRVLARFGRHVLWASEPDDAVLRECLAMAKAHAVDDDVLAEMVTPPEQALSSPESMRYAAARLSGTVLPGGSSGDAYTATREALARNPLAVAEYLVALASSGRGAPEFLNWLAPRLTADVVRLFRMALGLSPGDLTVRDAGELAALGPGCLRALLAVGSSSQRLDALLPSFTSWLASRGELEPTERRSWSEHLRSLSVGSATLRAYLDTALLTIGAAPTALPPPAGTMDSAPYITAVTEIWPQLSREYALFSAERCVRALARYLEGQDWAARKGQAAAVTDLTGRLLRYDREHVLAGAVGSALAAVPAAKRWDFAQDWLARVRKDDPEAVRTGLLAALRTAEPGTEPGQLAGLCVRAHHEGVTADQAFQQLAKSGALDSGAAAVAMLAALRQEFVRYGVGFTETRDWLFILIRMLVLGPFGENVGQDFRERMSSTVRREIELQVGLLANLAEAGRDGQYVLTDDERDDMVRFKDAFEFIHKKSRKSPSLWKWAANAGPAAQESG